MYVGHVGAALAAKRVHRSVGLLVLLIATYTPDWVDSALCLGGSYSASGMLSHSIPAVALFAVLGFVTYGVATRDWRGAMVIAAVVVSHMLFDWITGHKPSWPGGPTIGLGLYEQPVADFIVEGVVIVVGVALYARTLPSRRRAWIDVSVMLVALLGLQLGVGVARILLESLPKC
jgi:membrane-bound metal-dependent hydrolase YbcI (DUF457 family)